jgi:perosamine synthetase
MIRKQLPVYSPLSLRSIWHGSLHAMRNGDGASIELQRVLLAEFRAEAAVLCGSGTQALQLAIGMALAESDINRVVLPAFSCFDVAAAAVGAGAEIALYDLEPGTLGPDLESLERQLQAGARAVVISPLYGIPVEWEEIAGLCARYGAVAVEDAAQGHGAAWNGRPLGSIGDISVVSFGRGKGWTGGSGGALLLRGSSVAARDRLPRLGGRTPGVRPRALAGVAAQWALGRPATYGVPASLPWLALGETIYHDPSTPAAMSEFAAALALRTKGEADAEIPTRRENALAWTRDLPGDVGSSVRHPASGSPGYLRFPIRLPTGMHGFHSAGAARNVGIMPSYPSALPALPAVRSRLTGVRTSWRGAEELVATLVTLPTHSRVTQPDRQRVASLIEAAAGG